MGGPEGAAALISSLFKNSHFLRNAVLAVVSCHTPVCQLTSAGTELDSNYLRAHCSVCTKEPARANTEYFSL